MNRRPDAGREGWHRSRQARPPSEARDHGATSRMVAKLRRPQHDAARPWEEIARWRLSRSVKPANGEERSRIPTIWPVRLAQQHGTPPLLVTSPPGFQKSAVTRRLRQALTKLARSMIGRSRPSTTSLRSRCDGLFTLDEIELLMIDVLGEKFTLWASLRGPQRTPLTLLR